MKQRIIENIDSPEMLEKLFRENNRDFSKSFEEIATNRDSALIRFWKLRLAHVDETESTLLPIPGLILLIILSLGSFLLIKIPDIFERILREPFYLKDVALIEFNAIILFTFWQQGIKEKKHIVYYGLIVLVLAVYVNLLPVQTSDSLQLVYLHIPLFLWCLFGLTYISFEFRNHTKWMEFIRFNGELVVMTGLLCIAGVVFTGITMGLFSAIKLDVKQYYFPYVALLGAIAIPLVALYLIRLYPTITNKIAPVIAKVFTPLVFITLTVYLISLFFTGNKIMEDREVLIIFNIMLLAVMAIIVFSVSGLEAGKGMKAQFFVLFLLASLAILIDAIALVAIGLRVSEGLTPNRIVVLVSNILVLLHLFVIAKTLFRASLKNSSLDFIAQGVTKFMMVYMIWTLVVIFVLPFAFQLK